MKLNRTLTLSSVLRRGFGTTPTDTYTHGHHASVVHQHASRTLENSCAFLIPHLKPGMKILDIGCGPGTITAGFPDYIGAKGSVTGADYAASIVKEAKEINKDKLKNFSNLQFQTGDVYNLDYPDASFDLVNAHQVLQHLSDPVRALTEMKRVAKKGGLVTVRDSDYITMRSYPIFPGIELWREKYMAVCYRNKAEPRAGIFLKHWAIAAGFNRKRIKYGNSILLRDENLDVTTKKDWGNDWVVRALESSFAKQALEYGIATQEELEFISREWKRFADDEDAIFYHVAGEMIAQV